MKPKYRAWDSDRNVMIPMHKDGICAFFADDSPVSGYGCNDVPNHIHLMMWTGCVDDNLIEIYAGDILRIMDEEQRVSYVEVRWVQGSLVVEGDFGDYDVTTVPWALEYWDNDCCKVEVVGNIYQTPELLPK
jgi:uncharacterized phage protein (TIGR01671 family)